MCADRTDMSGTSATSWRGRTGGPRWTSRISWSASPASTLSSREPSSSIKVLMGACQAFIHFQIDPFKIKTDMAQSFHGNVLQARMTV